MGAAASAAPLTGFCGQPGAAGRCGWGGGAAFRRQLLGFVSLSSSSKSI